MKVAICYFGVVRTLKKTFSSHSKHIFDILKKYNIDYDIYVHTWYGSLIHRRGHNENTYPFDPKDYLVLNPRNSILEDQDVFIKTIQFDDFFYKDIFEKYGEGRDSEWFPDLVLFHLCSLESQRKVIELMKTSGCHYDKIIMIRPDIELKEDLPIECILFPFEKTVFIPNFEAGEGYNDRFAIFHASEIEPYANRIQKAKQYRASVGRIVGEKYLKYTLDTNGFRVLPIDLKVPILRE